MNDNKHLTDEAVAMCAEAMMSNGLPGRLPGCVKTHLIECEFCAERVIGLYQDIKDEPEVIHSIKKHHLKAGKARISLHNLVKYAAAVLLLLIAAGSYFLLRPVSGEKLFKASFEPYPNIITLKSAANFHLSLAMLHYELRDWDSAIVLFHRYLEDEQYLPEALFYLGISYLANNQSDQAISWLKKANDENSRFSNHIQWYIALAHLNNNDKQSARNKLESVSREENFYRSKAKNLLKRLR